MVFLQSITKHADKLTNFADSKSKVGFKTIWETYPLDHALKLTGYIFIKYGIRIDKMCILTRLWLATNYSISHSCLVLKTMTTCSCREHFKWTINFYLLFANYDTSLWLQMWPHSETMLIYFSLPTFSTCGFISIV